MAAERFDAYTVSQGRRVVYVGITINGVQRRWKKHLYDASTGRAYGRLAKAIIKHGASKFSVMHVASAVNKGRLDELERVLIRQYDTCASGYNNTSGGSVGYTVKNVPRRWRNGAMAPSWAIRKSKDAATLDEAKAVAREGLSEPTSDPAPLEALS